MEIEEDKEYPVSSLGLGEDMELREERGDCGERGDCCGEYSAELFGAVNNVVFFFFFFLFFGFGVVGSDVVSCIRFKENSKSRRGRFVLDEGWKVFVDSSI